MRKALLCLALVAVLAAAAQAAEQQVSKLIFPNGFRLLVKPEPGKGLVAVSVVIRAGAAEEEAYPGMGQIVSRSLFSGARNLSDRKLAQLADDVGGSFAVSWDLDYTEVYIATTTEQVRPALELLAEILLSPKFDPKAVETAREGLLADIPGGKDGAFVRSYNEIRKLLYRDNPYRRPFNGNPSSLKSITIDQMNQFAARWFVPSNMVMAVVGDISTEEVNDIAKLWWGKQPSVALPPRTPARAETGAQAGPTVLELDAPSSYIIAGTLAAGMADPNYAADSVLATVLGGGKASRMFQDLREQQGLAYELGSLYPPLLSQSHLLVYVLAATYIMQPDDTGERPVVETIRAALSRTIDSLSDREISQAEIDRAKSYLIGRYALRHERLNERAKHLAWYEALGLGHDFDRRFPELVNAVPLDAVHKSAKRLFSNSAMVLVLPKE